MCRNSLCLFQIFVQARLFSQSGYFGILTSRQSFPSNFQGGPVSSHLISPSHVSGLFSHFLARCCCLLFAAVFVSRSCGLCYTLRIWRDWFWSLRRTLAADSGRLNVSHTRRDETTPEWPLNGFLLSWAAMTCEMQDILGAAPQTHLVPVYRLQTRGTSPWEVYLISSYFVTCTWLYVSD